MSKILYVECNSGISGDMFVASLLDLGADEEYVLGALKSLGLSGYEIKISRVKRAGLDLCDFDVVMDEAHATHDHDMEYLYGHVHEHHDHEHEHTDHHHHHEHRSYGDIKNIINNATLPGRVAEYALNIFSVIAAAESKAHGVSIDEVHFHEVGAIDSIVDIVAAAACVDSVGADEVVFSPLTEGHGSVRCQHGILPVPVPAVLNILSDADIRLRRNNIHGELITPTGAAIAAAMMTRRELPEEYEIISVGAGAGKRMYDPPSMVRAMLLEADTSAESAGEKSDGVWKLETDIDDATGEALGYVMERLYEAGAKEVHFSSVQMKKNRPGVELVIICDDDSLEAMENIVFSETTTIGIRRTRMQRTVLKRQQLSIQTPIGEAELKSVTLPDGTIRKYPEYESVKKLAKKNNISYWQALNEVVKEENNRTKTL